MNFGHPLMQLYLAAAVLVGASLLSFAVTNRVRYLVGAVIGVAVCFGLFDFLGFLASHVGIAGHH
jgi:hypothetical protein